MVGTGLDTLRFAYSENVSYVPLWLATPSYGFYNYTVGYKWRPFYPAYNTNENFYRQFPLRFYQLTEEEQLLVYEWLFEDA